MKCWGGWLSAISRGHAYLIWPKLVGSNLTLDVVMICLQPLSSTCEVSLPQPFDFFFKF